MRRSKRGAREEQEEKLVGAVRARNFRGWREQSLCRSEERIFLLDEDFNTSVDKFVEKDRRGKLTQIAPTRSPVCTIFGQWRFAESRSVNRLKGAREVSSNSK
jgi:hypothetical protein